MTDEYNLHPQNDRTMISTNELPENTIALNNTRFGPMTWRDWDETDYSVPYKTSENKLTIYDVEDKLYAANM